jgi:hypothetical protein
MKEQKRAEAEERKAAARIRREQEKRVAEIEMQIATLEGRQKELIALLEDPMAYERGGQAVAFNRELSSVVEELARLNDEWTEAAAVLISKNGE